jgi:hypothetical protein
MCSFAWPDSPLSAEPAAAKLGAPNVHCWQPAIFNTANGQSQIGRDALIAELLPIAEGDRSVLALVRHRDGWTGVAREAELLSGPGRCRRW